MMTSASGTERQLASHALIKRWTEWTRVEGFGIQQFIADMSVVAEMIMTRARWASCMK